MFTKDTVRDINYVLIGVELKKDRTTKIKGIFLGCQPMVKAHTQLVSKDEEFFWLYRNNTIYMLNLAHYAITMMEISSKNLITSFTAKEAVQAEYIERLKRIQKSLAENNKTMENGLIDIDAYDIPDKIHKELANAPLVSGVTNSATKSKSTTTTTKTNDDDGVYNVYKKKEVTTFAFKRTTKYPIKDAIKKMSEKVEEIRKGTYKPPELKSLTAAIDVKGKEDEEGDINYYDDFDVYFNTQ